MTVAAAPTKASYSHVLTRPWTPGFYLALRVRTLTALTHERSVNSATTPRAVVVNAASPPRVVHANARGNSLITIFDYADDPSSTSGGNRINTPSRLRQSRHEWLPTLPDCSGKSLR